MNLKNRDRLIGRGTMGAVGTLAPVLEKVWGMPKLFSEPADSQLISYIDSEIAS